MNKLIKWFYKNRAKFYTNKILPYIHENEKVLDIGAGTGYVGVSQIYKDGFLLLLPYIILSLIWYYLRYIKN